MRSNAERTGRALAKDDPVAPVSVQNNGANIADWAQRAGAAGAHIDQSAVQTQVKTDAQDDQ